jgi:alkanesulfonate monooxygenase SsuD/methylene tetrahydromethanopterin reductase-like flavin-dependent oxidoreductase (luciferase family)
MLDTLSIVGEYDEVAGRIKERFGNLLDEYVFTIDTPTPVDEQVLKKIIEELKS